MKQRYNKAQKPTRPFEGLIKQLNKESLILVNLNKAEDFVRECGSRGIVCGVGSTYKDGIVIYKKN